MPSDPFIGEIALVAFDFAPQGWALCDGQLLPIAQNQALFALLGTTYGGDGHTTFALPDLRGRVPLHAGPGPGLTHHAIGGKGGAEVVVLNVAELPPHSHVAEGSSGVGTTSHPNGALWATSAQGDKLYRGAAHNDRTIKPMASQTIQSTGGGHPHPNMPPFLAMNYIIALQGIFPARA